MTQLFELVFERNAPVMFGSLQKVLPLKQALILHCRASMEANNLSANEYCSGQEITII